jgi:RNA polymerase sigma-70 factor (ECF subfamily)
MSDSSFAIDVPELQIARLKRRDLEAFEQVYRLFNRPVYTLALRLLQNESEAYDLLQDAFLKAFEQIAQFRGEAPFWGWLRSIVVNLALMRLRGRRPFESFEGEGIDEPGPASDDPLSGMCAQDLMRALGKLPPVSRAVLWLYHVEGYSHEEIARQFERSVSFSKSQLARAGARLRELVKEEDGTWNPATIPA